jgi:hypothetical protein
MIWIASFIWYEMVSEVAVTQGDNVGGTSENPKEITLVGPRKIPVSGQQHVSLRVVDSHGNERFKNFTVDVEGPPSEVSMLTLVVFGFLLVCVISGFAGWLLIKRRRGRLGGRQARPGTQEPVNARRPDGPPRDSRVRPPDS